jgi:AraC-like DNA-binding protein
MMAKTTAEMSSNPLQLDGEPFQRSRHLPAQDLAFFVGYYWIVKWDLRREGGSYLSESLPQPCVHLVFEKDQSRVVGIARGRSSYLLENTGHIFGVSFKPGAFFPFMKKPVSTLTDISTSIFTVLGAEHATLEEAIFSQENEAAMIALVEQFLRERLPERDEHVVVINQIVDRIIADREITRVDHVVSCFSISKRTLQRFFSEYVGVSPKWVISRYRLQEAAEHLAESEVVDWPQLALDLGYFDQAHFINDFKTIIGKTPAEYVKQVRSDPSSFVTCDMLRKVHSQPDV